MSRPKSERLGYEFECGCRTKVLKRIDVGADKNGNRIRLSVCPEHRKKIKHVHLLCSFCKAPFTSQMSTKLRCPECETKNNIAKNIKSKAKCRALKPKIQRDPKIIEIEILTEKIDNTCGALCINRDKCLSDHLFRGKEFVCTKCEKYERFDITGYTFADGEQILNWTFR